MAFSPEIKDQAYARSGGRCECERQNCLHSGRCQVRVKRHGKRAEFHHRHAERLDGPDSLSNCEVLCLGCHRLTVTFGQH